MVDLPLPLKKPRGRIHVLPMALPLAVLVAAAGILWKAPGTPDAFLTHGPGDATAGEVAFASQVSLLDEALTASGLRDLGDLAALGESGVWLALPGGPLLARWLEPELRLMLGLRGKLNSGGPFAMQGPVLLQQAGAAAETLLRRGPPPGPADDEAKG